MDWPQHRTISIQNARAPGRTHHTACVCTHGDDNLINAGEIKKSRNQAQVKAYT